MSLAEFQKAFGALIAVPGLCDAVRADAGAALVQYDLSSRETRRLAHMAAQPGMAASCKLYRANRLTPLHRFLPRTLTVLGPVLRREIDQFWRIFPHTRLQFEEEVAAFAGYLETRIQGGVLTDPLVAEMLHFEAAACRLLFLRSGKPVPRPGESTTPRDRSSLVLHPLVAVAAFRREPTALLAWIDAGKLPKPPPHGEYYLLLDARNVDLSITPLSTSAGRTLAAIQAGAGPPDRAALQIVLDAGLLLSTIT
jgi:hypothetical protein